MEISCSLLWRNEGLMNFFSPLSVPPENPDEHFWNCQYEKNSREGKEPTVTIQKILEGFSKRIEESNPKKGGRKCVEKKIVSRMNHGERAVKCVDLQRRQKRECELGWLYIIHSSSGPDQRK